MMGRMATTVAGAAAEDQAARVDTHLAVAALRILTGVAGLWALRLLRPWDFAGIGLERDRGVFGVELIDLFPQGSTALHLGTAVMVVALVAVTVGWHARLAAGVSLALGLWLYGMSFGIAGTTHIHHLLLLLAVLAASPCDARLAVRPRAGDGDAAAWAMLLVRLGIGLVYFFPGWAKLQIIGEWPGYLEDHIANHQALYSTAVEWVPPTALVTVMAWGAVAFEVSFVVLVFTRWRRPAVVGAICFHVATGLLMGIWFPLLVMILPALLLPMRLPEREPSLRFLPAGALVAGSILAGLTGTTAAWPAAHYPRFDHRPEGVEVTVAIATTDDGDRYRAGQVLLPHHAPAYWSKLEHTHDVDELDAAVAAKVGEPVTIEWENP